MIGILPAAGTASRMHGLPKYLLPIPDDEYLLNRHIGMMRREGASIHIGTNPRNDYWLRDFIGGNVYLARSYATMTQTVMSVMEHQEDANANVLFGMPDTYIEDNECYTKLADALTDCDVAVAVFETRPEQRGKLGMCQLKAGYIVGIQDKPLNTSLIYAWGAIAWKPTFWDYLQPEMLHVGYGLQCALDDLNVRAVMMDGGYWDCGTPTEYFDLITHLHRERV